MKMEMKRAPGRALRGIPAVVAAALLLCTAGAAAEPGEVIDLAFEYWLPTLSGEILIIDDDVAGSRIDFVDTVAMDDSEAIPGARMILRLGERNRLVLAYFQTEHTGMIDLHEGVTFGGRVYSIEDTVRSKLETSLLEGWYERVLVGGETGSFNVLLGVQYTEMKARLSSDIVGSTARSVKITNPAVGLALESSPTEKLSIRAEALGILIDLSDAEASAWDVRLEAGYHLTANLKVNVAYRFLGIDVKESEGNEGEFGLDGPLASVALVF